MEDNIFDKIHEVDLKKDDGNLLYRLCDECYCIPCASGCQRWFETGTETSPVLHDRAEQWSGQAAS